MYLLHLRKGLKRDSKYQQQQNMDSLRDLEKCFVVNTNRTLVIGFLLFQNPLTQKHLPPRGLILWNYPYENEVMQL